MIFIWIDLTKIKIFITRFIHSFTYLYLFIICFFLRERFRFYFHIQSQSVSFLNIHLDAMNKLIILKSSEKFAFALLVCNWTCKFKHRFSIHYFNIDIFPISKDTKVIMKQTYEVAKKVINGLFKSYIVNKLISSNQLDFFLFNDMNVINSNK